jgi:hypothetical protein
MHKYVHCPSMPIECSLLSLGRGELYNDCLFRLVAQDSDLLVFFSGDISDFKFG